MPCWEGVTWNCVNTHYKAKLQYFNWNHNYFKNVFVLLVLWFNVRLHLATAWEMKNSFARVCKYLFFCPISAKKSLDCRKCKCKFFLLKYLNSTFASYISFPEDSIYFSTHSSTFRKCSNFPKNITMFIQIYILWRNVIIWA